MSSSTRSFKLSIRENVKSVDAADVEKRSTVLNIDPAIEKRVMRRVDWHLLPFLGLLYAVALIDRANLGVARVAGMDADLKLYIGQRYSIASFIYFIPYILFQLPSNLLLRRLGVRVWLSLCVIGWGAAQLGMGFVPTWGYLSLTRVFLGVFESGFAPAMFFIITTWYTRREVQKRLAAFYCISVLIGGFSAILGYALSLLAGKGGLAGWSWIFVVEGILTIVLGIVAFFYIPEFPDQNDFLEPEQTKLVLARVEADRGDSIPDELTKEKIFKHLADWTIWAYGFMYMSATVPAYAISYFITIILRSMGYSIKDSLLLTTPPYVVAVVSAMAFAWISDKTQKRAIFIAIQTVIIIIGLTLTGYSKIGNVRYFGLFLGNAGASGCIPAILTFSANNIASQSKRAVSTAVIVAFGGIGGIVATTVFRQQDAPGYLNGIWVTLGCQFLSLALAALLAFTYRRRNAAISQGAVYEERSGFVYTI